MNVYQTSTVTPSREASQPVSRLRRAVQRLTRGPAALHSPAARWAINVLAVVGAGLTVWSGVIHLQLWSEGYKDISVIGPLFLVQGIGSIVVALALGVFRRVFLLAAGAALMAGTGVGLLLSATVGLFGYQESLAITDAQTSLMVEFVGAAVLAGAAVVLAAARPRAGHAGHAGR
jgi:hypothetical protein